MDDKLKQEILQSIELAGASAEENIHFRPMIGHNASSVIENTKGLPRVKQRLVEQFKLILAQPLLIKALSPLSIRCVLCKRVISYPCWYREERFNVNWFHYFICFNPANPSNVTARCYKRQ